MHVVTIGSVPLENLNITAVIELEKNNCKINMDTQKTLNTQSNFEQKEQC